MNTKTAETQNEKPIEAIDLADFEALMLASVA